MNTETALENIGMYVDRGCLVVPIQIELDDDTASKLQDEILQRIAGTRSKGLIIDLTAVAVLDTYLARLLFNTLKMAGLMGARAVITGLRPGVAVALIDLGFEPGEAATALTLEGGFEIVAPPIARVSEPGGDEPEPAVDGREPKEVTDPGDGSLHGL